MLMLLALHKARARRAAGTRVVAEMRDRANVEIARTIEVDDFIVSDELSSLMLAQVSERLELHAVFRELFDASGSVLTLRPAARYAPAEEAAWAATVAAAGAHGESAIGYRVGSSAVVLNPAKTTALKLGAEDHVLVLARRAPATPDVQPVLFPGDPSAQPAQSARGTEQAASPLASLAGRQLDVPAEGLAHRGQELVGVDRLAAAAEPRKQ